MKIVSGFETHSNSILTEGKGNMAIYSSSNKWKPVSHMPIKRIGIVYCTSTQTAAGRETEKLADCEVVEVANAVQAALQAHGYQAELVNLDPDQIDDLCRFDWIFNLAESIYGYPLADFQVAQQMEKLGIKFTGSGSKTLKTCLDKAAAKCELLRNGIGTPAFEVFQPGSYILNLLRYPLFVKPVHEDGSIGIQNDSIVHNNAELKHQVEKIHQMYHQAALVEQYIDGRDITASVIGNGEQAVVLPLSEITYPQQLGPKFLTFQGKWVNDSLDYQVSRAQCPSLLPPQTENIMKDIALRAYNALGCRDYARVDFRLRGKCPFVLEVNPNPCINPDDSGFVRSGNAAGFSYANLVNKILENAVYNSLCPIENRYLDVLNYQTAS
jgi:D-alanine-D-alanine ligase